MSYTTTTDVDLSQSQIDDSLHENSQSVDNDNNSITSRIKFEESSQDKPILFPKYDSHKIEQSKNDRRSRRRDSEVLSGRRSETSSVHPSARISVATTSRYQDTSTIGSEISDSTIRKPIVIKAYTEHFAKLDKEQLKEYEKDDIHGIDISSKLKLSNAVSFLKPDAIAWMNKRKPNTIVDKSYHSTVTPSKALQLLSMFRGLDIDNSGEISKDELRNALNYVRARSTIPINQSLAASKASKYTSPAIIYFNALEAAKVIPKSPYSRSQDSKPKFDFANALKSSESGNKNIITISTISDYDYEILEKFFDYMDVTKDGHVDFNEFVKHITDRKLAPVATLSNAALSSSGSRRAVALNHYEEYDNDKLELAFFNFAVHHQRQRIIDLINDSQLDKMSQSQKDNAEAGVEAASDSQHISNSNQFSASSGGLTHDMSTVAKDEDVVYLVEKINKTIKSTTSNNKPSSQVNDSLEADNKKGNVVINSFAGTPTKSSLENAITRSSEIAVDDNSLKQSPVKGHKIDLKPVKPPRPSNDTLSHKKSEQKPIKAQSSLTESSPNSPSKLGIFTDKLRVNSSNVSPILVSNRHSSYDASNQDASSPTKHLKKSPSLLSPGNRQKQRQSPSTTSNHSSPSDIASPQPGDQAVKSPRSNKVEKLSDTDKFHELSKLFKLEFIQPENTIHVSDVEEQIKRLQEDEFKNRKYLFSGDLHHTTATNESQSMLRTGGSYVSRLNELKRSKIAGEILKREKLLTEHVNIRRNVSSGLSKDLLTKNSNFLSRSHQRAPSDAEIGLMKTFGITDKNALQGSKVSTVYDTLLSYNVPNAFEKAKQIDKRIIHSLADIPSTLPHIHKNSFIPHNESASFGLSPPRNNNKDQAMNSRHIKLKAIEINSHLKSHGFVDVSPHRDHGVNTSYVSTTQPVAKHPPVLSVIV